MATGYKTLEIEKKNAVTVVWMNRPEQHNAFDEVLIRELTALCKVLADDETVRVVVLAGRGKVFLPEVILTG